MGENKGQGIFLSVVGIATLLVAIIGATFAFFTTTLDKDTAISGSVTTATMSQVKLEGTTISGTAILPGWTSGEKTFKISAATMNNGSATYSCSIIKSGTGTSTDFEYAVTGADNSTYGSWTTVPATSTVLVTGTIKSDNLSDTYKINFRFNETGKEQTNQGQTFGATVTCSLTSVNGKAN